MKKKTLNTIYVSIGILTILLILNRRRAVSLAKSFVGLEEIRGNLGFENPEFQKMMEEVGWKSGLPWCSFFVKVIWTKSYPEIKDILNKLISGSVLTTYNNFLKDKSGLFEIDTKPKKGDIIIWRNYDNGKPTIYGHTGIVRKVFRDRFQAVEGNTSKSGSREGLYVGYNWHDIVFEKNKTNGSRLIGFIRYKFR